MIGKYSTTQPHPQPLNCLIARSFRKSYGSKRILEKIKERISADNKFIVK
jgi:hypothetical protein